MTKRYLAAALLLTSGYVSIQYAADITGSAKNMAQD